MKNDENEVEEAGEAKQEEQTAAAAGDSTEPDMLAVQKTEPVDPDDDVDNGLMFDLSEDYEEIFGQNPEYDSWDEFSSLLEEFSKRTGFYYKPRSACTVEYLNEKRVNAPIPDRFVYAKVKMICVHYGDPPKSENGHTHRKGFVYVGKGCEACFQVSYNKGALRIGKSCLVHKNHGPRSQDDGTPLRQFRNFTFTEDLDMLIAREVLRNNPFELVNGEKRWIQAVETLKGEDTRLTNLTPRLVKKRIRFLLDKFVALSHGRMPTLEDEMGNILYQLNRTKRDRMDNPTPRGRRRKATQSPKRFSASLLSDNGDLDLEDLSGAEEEQMAATNPRGRKRKRSHSPNQARMSQSGGGDMGAYMDYLKRKEEEDRRIRLQELELAREELAFRKREMDFQKQRFEFEKFERKAHLDLLKAQLGMLERNQMSLKQEAVTKEREQPVEYTIVLDNNQHTVVQ